MTTHAAPPPSSDGPDEVWTLTDDPEDDQPMWPDDLVGERDPRR